MPVSLQNERGNNMFFAALLLTLVSLFISRAVLSLAVIFFFLTSLFHHEHLLQLKKFLQTPFLWIISLLFVVPLVSDIWTEEKDQWLDTIRVKLPLLALPFAYASPLGLSPGRWKIVGLLAIILVFLASMMSFVAYLMEARLIHESFLEGKSLPTAFGNDRVRFSWVSCLASLAAGWVGFSNWRKHRPLACLFLLIAAWLALYLHILAVRTGLLCFYLLFTYICVLLIKNRFRIFILIFLITLPLLAWFTLPSFQNRMKYLAYEFDFAKDLSYIPGSTDPIRFISIKNGLEQFREKPLLGQGFGDIAASSKEWYNENYPGMKEEDKILPSSEYILYAAGSGIVGLFAIIAVVLTPFLMKCRQQWAWRMLGIAVIVSFLFDIGLEVQYGVLVYCLLTLSCWKWMEIENR